MEQRGGGVRNEGTGKIRSSDELSGKRKVSHWCALIKIIEQEVIAMYQTIHKSPK